MRGDERVQGLMFATVVLVDYVPADHPRHSPRARDEHGGELSEWTRRGREALCVLQSVAGISPCTTVGADRGNDTRDFIVAITGHPRLAYAEVRADETGPTTAACLRRAGAWYATYGIVVQRFLTDKGVAYRSTPFAIDALGLGVSLCFTQPRRTQTNGQAERFSRTLLTERAYATADGRSGWRTRLLRPYFSSSNQRPSSQRSERPVPRLPLAGRPVDHVRVLRS